MKQDHHYFLSSSPWYLLWQEAEKTHFAFWKVLGEWAQLISLDVNIITVKLSEGNWLDTMAYVAHCIPWSFLLPHIHHAISRPAQNIKDPTPSASTNFMMKETHKVHHNIILGLLTPILYFLELSDMSLYTCNQADKMNFSFYFSQVRIQLKDSYSLKWCLMYVS